MAMSLLPAETRKRLLDMISLARCCSTSAVSFPMYSLNILSWVGCDRTPWSHTKQTPFTHINHHFKISAGLRSFSYKTSGEGDLSKMQWKCSWFYTCIWEVRSSMPEPPEAKETPVMKSWEFKLLLRYAGTVSFTPSADAAYTIFNLYNKPFWTITHS